MLGIGTDYSKSRISQSTCATTTCDNLPPRINAHIELIYKYFSITLLQAILTHLSILRMSLMPLCINPKPNLPPFDETWRICCIILCRWAVLVLCCPVSSVVLSWGIVVCCTCSFASLRCVANRVLNYVSIPVLHLPKHANSKSPAVQIRNSSSISKENLSPSDGEVCSISGRCRWSRIARQV